MSHITADQRKTFEYYRRTFVRDNYRCVYCGKDMLSSLDDWLSLEVDHLVPKTGGGTDAEDNLVTSCKVCNKLKSSYFRKKPPMPQDKDQQIEIMREYVLKKRMVEQLRWLKALQQFDYFKRDGKLTEDSKMYRFGKTSPEILDG